MNKLRQNTRARGSKWCHYEVHWGWFGEHALEKIRLQTRWQMV